jgi:hypothetical protein
MPSPTINNIVYGGDRISVSGPQAVYRPGAHVTIAVQCSAQVNPFLGQGTVTGYTPVTANAIYGVSLFPVVVTPSTPDPVVTWTQDSTDGITSVFSADLPVPVPGCVPAIISMNPGYAVSRPGELATMEVSYQLYAAQVLMTASVAQTGWTTSGELAVFYISPGTIDISLTDDFDNEWTMIDDNGNGVATFTTTIPDVPVVTP